MPTSLVGGLFTSLAGGGVTAIWDFLLGAALNLVIRAASGGFKKKPTQNAFGSQGRLTTLRQPIGPRQVIFGEARVGGTITYAHVQASSNGYFFHLVITLAGHQCQEISEVWLDDEVITNAMLDASGNVLSGRYRNVEFRGRTASGTVPATPFQVTIADAGPFGTDGLNGFDLVTLQVGTDGQGDPILTQLTDVSPAAPANGNQYSRSGSTITFHASAEGLSYGVNYRQNVSGAAVRIQKSLGAEAGQPFPDLVAQSEGTWTDAHRQSGCTKIYVRLSGDIRFFPNGVPNITAVVKGENRILDVRSSTTGWTDNAALIQAHYLSNAAWYGFGAVYANEIHTADLIAAANICDEAVALAAGGTEPRYTANGAFLTSEKPGDILARLLAASAGSAVEVGATWRVYAGAYTAPTVTLDEGDLRGGLRTEVLPDLRENCNAVKGVFTSPDNSWQPTDFRPIVSSTYLAEDNGERIWRDVDFSAFVTSGTQAQRLAKIELLRTRQALTVQAPWKLTAYSTVPGKTVSVSNTKYGWAPKVFEIFSSRLVVEPDDDGNPRLGVDQALRETAAAVYNWSTSEEQAIDIAPNTSLPDPFTVVAPGAPTVTEEIYATSGSAGVKSRAIVSIMAVVDPFLESYVFEYKAAAEAGYHAVQVPKSTTSVAVEDLAPGLYLFRALAVNSMGRTSLYSPITVNELHGLTAAPADPTSLFVIKSEGFGLASWVMSTDLDVQINGAAVIKHTTLTAGASWSDGIIVEEFPGGAIEGRVPLMTGTYMLKFRDSSGNWSAGFVSFVATEGMVTGFTTVANTTQDPTFPGTKTNVAVFDGFALQLDGMTLIDSMTDLIDSWPFIDSLGGIAADGEYAFSPAYLDHGTVATRRLEADIQALSFDTGDLIDDRLELIDDWDSFDGDAVNDCGATLYYSLTNDDPAGTPSWGLWTPFFVADVTSRAERFKLALASGNRQHNIRITTLRVDVKEPV